MALPYWLEHRFVLRDPKQVALDRKKADPLVDSNDDGGELLGFRPRELIETTVGSNHQLQVDPHVEFHGGIESGRHSAELHNREWQSPVNTHDRPKSVLVSSEIADFD